MDTTPHPGDDVHELAVLFRRLGAQMRHLVAEEVADAGLTPVQFLILGWLDEPRSMGSLGECMGMDASTVTGSIDRLEEEGLVERRPDPADRRVRLIHITTDGAEFRDRVHRRIGARSPVADRLTVDEIGTMVELMRKAVDGSPDQEERSTRR